MSIETIQPAEAVGKTIQAIRYGDLDSEIKVLFTDGTFLALEANYDYDDGTRLRIGGPESISDYDLRVFGIIDEAEHMRRCEARSIAREIEAQRQRLEQYRLLSKEFSGKDEATGLCECAICKIQGEGACSELTDMLNATIGRPT